MPKARKKIIITKNRLNAEGTKELIIAKNRLNTEGTKKIIIAKNRLNAEGSKKKQKEVSDMLTSPKAAATYSPT